MLKMNQKEPEEDKISVLQTLLDSTRQQYNELRLDNRYNYITQMVTLHVFTFKTRK